MGRLERCKQTAGQRIDPLL